MAFIVKQTVSEFTKKIDLKTARHKIPSKILFQIVLIKRSDGSSHLLEQIKCKAIRNLQNPYQGLLHLGFIVGGAVCILVKLKPKLLNLISFC